METCQCEKYYQIIDTVKLFTPGTMHPIFPRITVPENSCVAWVCNKTNHKDTRPSKPKLISTDTEAKQTNEPLETKWIPVIPGVISQKLVNESKTLHAPF
ncbi:hypothetical protein GWI33_003002 [Rhynchophorus ferrugineus]|uniref:Uncharacterized protein n=1 Tax=Rhynchophorus ferrugineus TaxID=354439 RepID=A0A834INE1_RHYFE|nr:hypothetical protein GWI33_003002 [Rhynchophorus ferrugineus]